MIVPDDDAEIATTTQPTLAAAMPAALLKKLERRNNAAAAAPKPVKEKPAVLDRENEASNPAPSSPARQRSRKASITTVAAAAPSTPDKPAAESNKPTATASPSKCVLEAQRLEEARKLRRQQQAIARAGAPIDDCAQFQAMIAQFRAQHPPQEKSPPASGGAPPRLRVCVRKRPLLTNELDANEFDVLTCFRHSSTAVLHQTRRKVDQERVLENHSFHFDDLFDEKDDTMHIYTRAARPLVASVFAGGRATCFAYGQTGSGKTFTMSGCGDASIDGGGIYGLAAQDLFAALNAAREHDDELTIGLSMFEIYREQVFDLIAPQLTPSQLSGMQSHSGGIVGKDGKISVLEDAAGAVQLVGLVEVEPADASQVLSLLELAQQSRRTANNSVNERSSRSHAVLQFVLRRGRTDEAAIEGAGADWLAAMCTGTASRQQVGKFTLVDLAGSERAADTQEADSNARAEGADINRSLLSLKECIRAMDEGHSHVPFRGSKLTQVLRDSFVAASGATCMIAHVAPANRSCDYSLNSLRYAERLRVASSSASSASSTAAAGPPLQKARSAPLVDAASPARRPPRAPPTTPVNAMAGLGSAERVVVPPPKAPTTTAAAAAVAVDVTDAAPASDGISAERRAATVEVLKDLLRCTYDPDAWEAELNSLEGLQERDLLGCVERVDQVLSARINLFTQLRGNLAAFKAKLEPPA